MVPELTHPEILEHLRNPAYQQRGFGLLITGGSRDERSTIANTALHQLAGGRYSISATPFEVVAADHYGLREQLVSWDVMLIDDLGPLSMAEEAAIDDLDLISTVTCTLESILDQRHQHGVLTLMTTEYELAELETHFSPRLAGLVEAVGFSIRLDGEGA